MERLCLCGSRWNPFSRIVSRHFVSVCLPRGRRLPPHGHTCTECSDSPGSPLIGVCTRKGSSVVSVDRQGDENVCRVCVTPHTDCRRTHGARGESCWSTGHRVRRWVSRVLQTHVQHAGSVVWDPEFSGKKQHYKCEYFSISQTSENSLCKCVNCRRTWK